MENGVKFKYFSIIVIIIATFAGGSVFLFGSKDSDKLPATNLIDNESGGTVQGVSTADQPATNTYKTITVSESKELIADHAGNPDFQIIDVRTPEEYAAGAIDGSTNIDFYRGFESEIAKLDLNKSYLIYCRTGNRSGQALEVFKKLGFKEVYDVEGGYNAWAASL